MINHVCDLKNYSLFRELVIRIYIVFLFAQNHQFLQMFGNEWLIRILRMYISLPLLHVLTSQRETVGRYFFFIFVEKTIFIHS